MFTFMLYNENMKRSLRSITRSADYTARTLYLIYDNKTFTPTFYYKSPIIPISFANELSSPEARLLLDIKYFEKTKILLQFWKRSAIIEVWELVLQAERKVE